MTIKKIVKWSAELIILILFVWLFSEFQTRNMLSGEKALPNKPLELVNLDTHQIVPVDLYQHNKKTLIYFFAPWCNVCHLSIENLDTLYLEHQASLNIVLIALSYQSSTEVEAFVKQHDLNVPVYLGNEAIRAQFKITGFPSYYVVDQVGQITYASVGFTSETGMKLRTWL
ncbi:redoxin domain-containing protein [Catenovulum sediminis]|uniref:redoxin domain-containing protein n=1 Tax=Catenovulum sediminis TaxID=1740262 RepID=UPI00117CD570|nr:thioredoxin-like domain-containing protein [Catenovulum sediminis]